MVGFDYGNARLRVMKARLLSRRELENLVEAGSLQGLIAALTKTNYRRAVETALARATGMDCILETLRNDLANALSRVRTFFAGQAGELVAIALRSYDVSNLKAILRGLSRNVSPSEILAALLPVGELKYADLEELAGASRLRVALDLMVSMGLPHATPLLKLRAERPGAEILEMELALEQWAQENSRQFLKEEGRDGQWLLAFLDLEADLANLLTALRFAHAPAERALLYERLGAEQPERLFVGPGKLAYKTLVEAMEMDTVASAIAVFGETPYQRPLEAGLEAYSRSGRLSDIEKRLNRSRLEVLSGWLQKDPLGIGVLLGYLALKTNEINNIRWVAEGYNLGLEVEAIRAEVEFVE